MNATVILITLIATFSGYDNVNFYSHNPNVLFVSKDMCNEVLEVANDYFYKGAESYVKEEFPKDTLSLLTVTCMEYSIDPYTGNFEPLEYDYEGDWNSIRGDLYETI